MFPGDLFDDGTVRVLLAHRYPRDGQARPELSADGDRAGLGGSTEPYQRLDDERWALVRERLRAPEWPILRLRQVHGVGVAHWSEGVGPPVSRSSSDVHAAPAMTALSVSSPAEAPIEIGVADCLLLTTNGAVGLIRTADCGGIAILADGAVALVHAGWKGLANGVIQAAIAELRARHYEPRTAIVGAHIGPCCYEFGADDLDWVATRVGDVVRSTNVDGAPALDLGAGIDAVCIEAGLEMQYHEAACTGCDDRYFSYRVRGDSDRHGILACVA